MRCTNCSEVLEVGSKFCFKCGAQAPQLNAGLSENQQNQVNNQFSSQQEFQQGNVQQQMQQTQMQNFTQQQMASSTDFSAKNIQENKYFVQGKNTSKQYYNYILQVLKAPMLFSRKATDVDFINGIISIVLFSFLFPLFTFFLTKKLSGGFFAVPFGEFVIKPAFAVIVICAIVVGITLAVSKFMKSVVSFKTIIAKFGTFLVIPSLIIVASIILAFLSIYSFAIILFLLSVLGFFISIAATLFSIKGVNNDGLDIYYGIGITYVVLIIVLAMLGESLLSSLLETISEAFWFF